MQSWLLRGRFLAITALLVGLIVAPSAFASHATGGTDVKVTLDNNNVDGGTPNPGFDAKNLPANETTVAISPANPNIIAAGANDLRMKPVFGDFWLGVYVSGNGGATWFNTMVPGFPSDTSPAGVASPLKGLDSSADPTVRFDAAGNLYVAGIAFNGDFDREDLSNDTVAYVAKYHYTPGSAGGTSTPSSAANPPNFTYTFTTIVDRGAVGFAVPGRVHFGFAGKFVDKNWLAVDTNATSPCFGAVYYTFTRFTGRGIPIVLSRSTDGGATFSEPLPVTQRGPEGSVLTLGSNIAVAGDGRVYVTYRMFGRGSDATQRVQVVRSDDCGQHFRRPVTAAVFTPLDAVDTGLAFRTPTNPWIAVDDTDPDTVYVAYMGLAGSPANADVFVARSTNGGATWGTPTKVNSDSTAKHQFWPTIAVSNGALHVAWYDFRDSPNPGDPAATNEVLNVYYASSNTTGAAYPAFSHNVKVTDVGHQPNCLIFGEGTVAFHGDYIELAARFDGANHVVHVAWTDNRDVPAGQCDFNPEPGPDPNATGNGNQNVYADKLTVAP